MCRLRTRAGRATRSVFVLPLSAVLVVLSGCSAETASVNFRSYHPGGSNFVLADGSVHFLAETIDLRTFGHLGARNDGEVLGSF